MGLCLCRPQTLVTEDPNVIMYTKVGFCALKGRYPEDFITLSRFGGLAYVRNTGHLCLESTIGSRFCCHCCSEGWRLSDISQVEVVNGSITVSTRDRYGTLYNTHHQLNPGLGIMLKNGDRILMKMPNAVNFCTRLRQQCNLPIITTSELQRMLWQAIMNRYTGASQGTGITSSASQGTGTTSSARQGTGITSSARQGTGTTSARQGTGTTSSARQGTGTTSSARQGTGTTSSASQGTGTTSSASQGTGTTSSARQGTDGPEDRQALIS